MTANPEPGWSFDELDKVRRRATALDAFRKLAVAVNPRPPGWHNGLIQFVKRLLARLLNWYTQPVHEFHSSVTRSLQDVVRAVDHLTMSLASLEHLSQKRVFEHLSVDLVEVEAQLAEISGRSALVAAPIRERIELLHQQVKLLVNLQEIANLEDAAATNGLQWEGVESRDRTTYVIGLFGTGRKYVNELLLQNLGERAKYFRDTIRLHPGPTPMIYSGHVTMKHVSRAQGEPAIMNRILEDVRAGFAQTIFIYRHPLDSLLTNWVWWREHMRNQAEVYGISEVYKNVNDLCADLEKNFTEFRAFAAGDPGFFTALPGPPFLSLMEFVEETELHLEAATLTLRLEDFFVDPSKEFSKILALMPAGIDSSRLSLPLPRTKPYGHLVVKERSPQFRDFIAGLNPETKDRIERIGYSVEL